MLTHREFSAWITSEGHPLPEYLVAVDKNANKVSCWIPSDAGKKFRVHWRDEGTRVCSCGFIALDGFVVPGRFLNGHGETSREGVRTGPETERPFVFAEQPNTSSGVRVNRDAGTIMLKIRLVSMDGVKVANPLQRLPEPSGPQSNILNHRISYGEEINTNKQNPFTWKVKPHDGSSNRSFVTFVFRYRSREFLLSQGIIPMEDALQIPPAVQMSCAMTRRVVSAPLPSSSSSTDTTPDATPSGSLERMGHASRPGSGPIRTATSARTASTPSHHIRYPGEGVLVLGSMAMWRERESGLRMDGGDIEEA